MIVTALPSPNHDSRDGVPVSMLVLHYTGMQTPQAAFERLCDPVAKVSAHYIVDEQGEVFRLVEENRRAWHAGVGSWRGQRNINQLSVGIEIVNPGHEWGYRPFPDIQMRSVIALSRDILGRHPIPPRNVVAHSDIAPTRKEDPGELFDWAWLAREGIGLWPSEPESRILNPESLAEYGYDTSSLPKSITAFQRHFRPKTIDGQWDSECQMKLAALLGMV